MSKTQQNGSSEDTSTETIEVSAEQISVRFECLKFAQSVRKENIENLWATRKQVPEELSVEELIKDAEKIWEYLISS
jgi:hypothetical protein